jgi:hypothetical protein
MHNNIIADISAPTDEELLDTLLNNGDFVDGASLTSIEDYLRQPAEPNDDVRLPMSIWHSFQYVDDTSSTAPSSQSTFRHPENAHDMEVMPSESGLPLLPNDTVDTWMQFLDIEPPLTTCLNPTGLGPFSLPPIDVRSLRDERIIYPRSPLHPFNRF